METLNLQSQSGVPCIKRLLKIAQGDIGGSRRIASVLLSLSKGLSFPCDLQALLYLEGNLLHELLSLILYLYQHGLQLDSLISQEEINPIVEMWGNSQPSSIQAATVARAEASI